MKREKGKDTEIDEDQNQYKFLGYEEISLLNLCNCLLFDRKERRYNTSHLNDHAPIKKFYDKYPELFTINQEELTDWARIVECLDGFEGYGEFEKKDVFEIRYKEGNNQSNTEVNKKNSIESDIINCINILIKICGLKHEEIWGLDEYQDKHIIDIENVIERLIQKIYGKEKKNQIIKIKEFKGDLQNYSIILLFEMKNKVISQKEIQCEFNTFYGNIILINENISTKKFDLNKIYINSRYDYYNKLIHGIINDEYKIKSDIEINSLYLKERLWYFSNKLDNRSIDNLISKFKTYSKFNPNKSEIEIMKEITKNLVLSIDYNDYNIINEEQSFLCILIY